MAVLLVSGFLGIFMIAREGGYHEKQAQLLKIELEKVKAEAANANGDRIVSIMYIELDLTPDQAIIFYDDAIKEIKQSMSTESPKLILRFKIQKGCFFIGVISLVIAFALPKICVIIQGFK